MMDKRNLVVGDDSPKITKSEALALWGYPCTELCLVPLPVVEETDPGKFWKCSEGWKRKRSKKNP